MIVVPREGKLKGFFFFKLTKNRLVEMGEKNIAFKFFAIMFLRKKTSSLRRKELCL